MPSPWLRNAFLIARREYKERVRSRVFRVSTLLLPLAFGLIFATGRLSSRAGDSSGHDLIASNDGELARLVATELNREDSDDSKPASTTQTRGNRFEAVTVPTSGDLAALNARVESHQIEGYLSLFRQAGEPIKDVTFASRSRINFGGSDRLRRAVNNAVVREQLSKTGLDQIQLDTLLKPVNVQTVEIKHGVAAKSDSGKSFWGAYIMAFLLYLTVLFYGVNVAQSVAAEKSSRVFEVLLASIEPSSLMAGKLIGVGGAGLTQLLIWIACVLLIGSSSIAPQIMEGGLAAYGVTPLQLAFFPVYFLLGFFFYSSLSAAVGAMVGSESEVQQFNMLIMLPQIIAMVLIVYILGNPAAWQVVLLSLLPPFTPIVMCLRMSAMVVPPWQLALSVLFCVVAICATVWLTSRIYRVGILMYGKRPTVPELLRWVQQN